MGQDISVMPDLRGLSSRELKVFEFILDKWPTFPLEIAKNMGEDLSDRDKKRRASTKYSYYLKKLVEKQLIISKKSGNSIVVWPIVVEKYRTIQEILSAQGIDSVPVMGVSQDA